jgi:predicted NBD/HSP70 family sugar kinase
MNTDGMAGMESGEIHFIPSPDEEKLGGDFVLGIDFGGTKIAIASADLEGNLLEQSRIETEASRGAMQAIERALALARSLMTSTAEKTGGRCIAAGAVSPGIVLLDRILLAPNVPGWEELALLDLVRDGLAIEQVAVGTDAKASAAAEVRWGNLQGADPAIFLSLGTGVAVALRVWGKVIRGAHGACGEIGYSLRGVPDELGFAQGHAPLEEAVGGRAIGERGSKLLGGNLSAAEVFNSSDVRARKLIDQALDELALHVANIAILIDPARIAVGGGLMGSGERILAALSSRLRSAVPFPPEVVKARFVHDSALRGAVSLALSAVQR